MQFSNLKSWAKALKRDVMTLWFALKHPQTPWHARAFAFLLTAYALSPIDLIPDFIPVLGYLDDLIIVPVGVWLLIRMVPNQVVIDSRTQADEWFRQGKAKPMSLLGLVIILFVWLFAAWAAYTAVFGN
jgi:uncharacterized membrane protein YkvA (DUF1232 family)